MVLSRLSKSLLLLTLLTSCGGGEDPAPDDDADGAVLGHTIQSLAEYRTATVTPYKGVKTIKPMALDPRAPGPVSGLVEPYQNNQAVPPDGRIGVIEALRSGCSYLETSRWNDDIRRSYAEDGKAFTPVTCGGAWSVDYGFFPPAYPGLFTPGSGHSGVMTGFVDTNLCIASGLMEFARAVEPQYIVGGKLPYITDERTSIADGQPKDIYFVSSSRTELSPQTREDIARLRAVTGGLLPTDSWAADTLLYGIEVPRATDSATWALLAVDFFREAALGASGMLACPQAELHRWVYRDGSEETADDHYSVVLAEAVLGMEEAAELGQQKITAAADERLAKATDKVAAVTENWVARFDSRLEAARAYLPLPPRLFDGWRAVPLYTASFMVAGDRPTPLSTAFVTDPYYWAHQTRQVTDTKAFVHSPDGPPPPNTFAIYSLMGREVPENPLGDALALTYPGSWRDLPTSPVNYQAVLRDFRLEGYIERDQSRGATVPLWSCWSPRTSPPPPRFITHLGACPSTPRDPLIGEIVGYAFPSYPSRAQLKGEFPVVTALQQSADEDAAEHFLRVTRVEPRLPDDPATLNGALEGLLRATARAYREDHPGVLGNLVTPTTVDTDGFLSLIGSRRESFLNAARRVAQEALAMGRGITPDPTITGSIGRVFGTSERWDSAEAAYYQALAQRSSHIAQIGSPDGTRSEVFIGAESDVGFFPAQHAYRGVYHADAYILGLLRDSRFRLRQNGRLTSATLDALHARLFATVEGWARVQTNMGSATGTTSLVDTVGVSLTDLRHPPATASAANAEYEVWHSEAGLDCALGKTTCNEANFKFPNLTWSVARAGLFELTLPARNGTAYRLPATAAALTRAVGGRTYLDKPLRVYITRRKSGGPRRALVGFTIDGVHPVVERNLWLTTGVVRPIQFIPFVSGAPEEDITDVIAPDPEEPEDGETHCTGLRNVKLEDELMEASHGSDDIESSFVYYLGVAKDAARQADALGEELISAGLSIDERSEGAREKLEELCGGVVNLESVPALAAAENTDLGLLLTEQEFATDDPNSTQLRSDLAGLRNCLGLGPEHAPINVAVGSDHLCYWRYESSGVKLPPCTVPSSVAAPTGNSCPHRAATCSRSSFNFSGTNGNAFVVEPTQGKLNVTAGLHIPSSAPDTADRLIAAQRFSCVAKGIEDGVSYETLKDECHYDPEDGSDPKKDMSWLTHSLLGDVGSRLGLRIEPFDVAVVTLDGREWLRFARSETGLSVGEPDENGEVPDGLFEPREWPCDSGTAPVRNGWFPAFRDAVGPMAPDPMRCEDDLLCGFYGCWNANWLEPQARVVKSVWLLKALGGASFDNFDRYSKVQISSVTQNGPFSTAIGMGPMPSWAQMFLDFSADHAGFFPGTWYRFGSGEDHGWCAPIGETDANWGINSFACYTIQHGGFEPNHVSGLGALDPNACVAEHLDPEGRCAWVHKAIHTPDAYPGGWVAWSKTGAVMSPAREGFSNPEHKPTSLTEVADVIELAAAASAQNSGLVGCSTALLRAPTINGPQDFPKLGRMLECAGERVEGIVRDMFLPGVPRSVAETSAEQGVHQTLPSHRGRMGEAVGSLGGWLEAYASATATVARALRDVGRDFAVTAAQLNIKDSQGELARLSMISKLSSAAAECAAAAAKASGNWGDLNFGDKMAVGIVCADSAVQMAMAIKSNKAELDILDEERRLVLLDLADRISQRMDAIDDARRGLGEAHAQVTATLAQIDSIRNQAAREVAKALVLESDAYGRVFPVNSVLHARYNTARKRYLEALEQAKQAAQMARLALEQRVGVRLADMSEDMALVEAPKNWANSVCALGGIDYERIRQGNTVEDEPTDPGDEAGQPEPYDYADQYIGDYVSKLRLVKDSWGLDFPFQEGDDTVVISLRDDLIGAYQHCDVSGPNELLQSVHAWNHDVDETDQPTMAWEGECEGVVCASALPSDDPAPLACYSADHEYDAACSPGSAMPDFGGARYPEPVRLYAHGWSSEAIPEDGLVVHLDARDITAAEGESIRVWPNRGTGSDATTPCTDGCLTYSEDGIYGQPALRLRGTPAGGTPPINQLDKLVDLGDQGLAADYTLVVVAQVDTNNSTNVVWSNGDLPGVRARLQDVGYRNVTWVSDRGSLAANGVSQQATPRLASVRGGASIGGTEIWRDGVLHASNTVTDGLRLGGILGKVNRASTNGPGTIKYGSVLMWNRALSDAELAEVHAHLVRRYRILPELPQGLTSWLRADHCGLDATTNVMRCADLSGSGAGAVALAATTSPALTTGGTAPALQFDGLDDSMAAMPTAADLTEHTTIVVAKVTAAPTATALLAGTTAAHLYADAPGAARRLAFGGTPARSAQVVSASNSFATDRHFVLTAASTAGGSTLYVDGTPRAEGPGIAIGDNGIRLGVGAGRLQGEVREVLMFDRRLEPVELDAVHAYLGQRHAVTMPDAVYEELNEGTLDTVAARYGQVVPVNAGRYWLSWYQRADQPRLRSIAYGLDGARASLADGGTHYPELHGSDPGASYIHPDWVRHYIELHVAAAGSLFVGWRVPSLPEGVAFAAPQLERSDDLLSSPPRPFFPTDADLLAPLEVCEDTDGEVFRSQGWREGEELACPLDDAAACLELAGNDGLIPMRYREISFDISQEAIDKGRILTHSGFARGNYNYRHRNLAVNMVGTAIKNCATTASPSTCHASNFLQYSLRHDGPYEVRTHDGGLFDADLFTGKIRQSKALLAERYLTNPMSSADRNLVGDFWNKQFRGRPLDGEYTLRIYEAEGLDWNVLEDVQIVLNYRYWTRLD